MTVKQYQEREKKIDEALFKKGIITGSYLYEHHLSIINEANRIINPLWANVAKIVPKVKD